MGSRSFASVLMIASFVSAACCVTLDTASAATPGDNVALGKSYTLWPGPSYAHCTDDGDRVQLTDGKTTDAYFWTQQGTVGWVHAPYVTITVDLGRVEPISGAALTTAAGVAGVEWPTAIHLLVSDDGRSYRDLGDLIAMDHARNGSWPVGYGIRRLVTNDLRARGRYVQFAIIPMPGSPYTFTDEVEVFRGPGALRSISLDDFPVASAGEIFKNGRIERAVRHRYRSDVSQLEETIRDAEQVAESEQARLLDALKKLSGQLRPDDLPPDDTFRAVLPIVTDHARLFQLQADVWKSAGLEPLHHWVPPTWDPLQLIGIPDAKGGMVRIDTMRGEYRAAAVNLANATQAPMDVEIQFVGLPGGPAPEYMTLHEVEWTDTGRGQPVAAALPEAKRGANGWSVTVRPGLVRQVWITCHAEDAPAGSYSGKLVAKQTDSMRVEVPVELCVWPLDFPPQTTLLLGGWSYTNGGGRYGVTDDNRAAFLKHVQQRFVNAPWATSSVMMRYEFSDSEPGEIELDTAEFDRWIADWPDARAYMVFLSVGHYRGVIKPKFAGAEIGTPEFDRRVKTWISAWIAHLRSKGIDANQLGLLIHDEPHEGTDIEPFLCWAKAIRQAEPEVRIWLDPTYRDPAKAPAELFEACDILCPNRPMWLSNEKRFERFYLDQQKQGRTLHFYSCSGPARLLDPYAYYRLQAWHAWKVGGKASFFWALGDNSGASSWNEYLIRSKGYAPMFLDDASVTPGKQMEAIRESAEDYETLVMLRRAIDGAKASGRQDDAVAQAESLLSEAADKVLDAAGADRLMWHDSKDRTIADAVRVEMLKALVALQQ